MSLRDTRTGAVAQRAAKPKPLVQQAYEEIKERIISLYFLPGQYLNEAAICDALEIGRTPVHQALQRLELEGLVEILPRKGVIIQPDTQAEILKILESRLTVEPELVRFAARRAAAGEITAAEIAELHRLAAEPDADENPPDINAFTTNDRAFHCYVGDLSDNSVMAEFARVLHERSTRYWYLNLWQTLDVGRSRDQHMAIAAAIAAGQCGPAGQAMSDHIGDLQARLSRIQRVAY